MTTQTTRKYDIGGYEVRMTDAQAARWNRGEVTAHDLRTVKVGLPDVYSQPSGLIDGEAVMLTPRLIRHSRMISLARATCTRLSPEIAVAMDGASAVLA